MTSRRMLPALLVSALSIATSPARAQAQFPGQAYQLGTRPRSVILEDVTNDGIDDIIVGAAERFGGVLICIGCADGTFMPPMRPSFYTAFDLAPGDFDGDGDIDVAYVSDRVRFLENLGGGEFYAQRRYFFAGEEPSAIVAHDIDRDGILDVVVSNRLSDDISLLFGRGELSLMNHTRIPAGTRPSGIVLADQNHDGVMDIVVANEDADQITVLLGVAAGTFARHGSFDTGPAPSAIASADLNADGNCDLAVANASGHSIMLGDGSGGFTLHGHLESGGEPSEVGIADVNNDGVLDVVSTLQEESRVSVFVNNGSASFGDESRTRVGWEPTCMALGDTA